MARAVGADPLAQYFLEKRNYVLKVGRLGLRHELAVTVGAFLSSFGIVRVKVIRARTWYRRSPKILWQDLVHPIREWRGRLKEEKARRRREREQRERQAIAARQTQKSSVGFSDAPIDGSATDLLRQYLSQLETLVTDAEARFSASAPLSN